MQPNVAIPEMAESSDKRDRFVIENASVSLFFRIFRYVT